MSTVRDQAAIRHTGSNSRGFSLVEILVVVMVILIIAAIAIPNLVQSKMRANEAAAVASVKDINTAETLFLSSYPEVGYASSLATLGSNGTTCEKPTSTSSCIIMDESLTSGLKNGYIFEIVGDGNKPSNGYTINASPESSLNGRCSVSSSETGEVRLFVPGASASPGKLSVGGGGGGCDI